MEEKIFSNININIPIYYRYDDILLAIPNNQINEILDRFNSYHDRLRFTVEHGDDKSINFLDVKVILKDECIKFDICKKPTNSGRYLSYKSNATQKKSTNRSA